MKKLLLFTLAAILTFSVVALGQNSLDFQIKYGNLDGSPVNTGPDRDIEIQIWGATAPSGAVDPVDENDTVNFIHMPLMSNDLYIISRDGGVLPPPPGVGAWDDVSFPCPNFQGAPGTCTDPLVPVGFTSQSELGFADIAAPPLPLFNLLHTDGAYWLLGTFKMHTTAETTYYDQTVCPFSEGHNPQNGATLWGMTDGVRGVNPTKTFGCIFFSRNQPPVWTTPATLTSAPHVVINLTGTDNDPLDHLTLAQVGGLAGTLTQTAGLSGGGVFTGTWVGNSPTDFSVAFSVSDGNNPPETLVVAVTISCGVQINDLNTTLSMASSPCFVGFPGANVDVAVNLTNPGCVGGFEILVQTDPTALSLVGITYTDRTNFGNEYHMWVADPEGRPGYDRIVFLANVNNGIYTPPIGNGTGAILYLTYHVTSDLPFGMEIPIHFIDSGDPDYDITDNTLSDETGYYFVHPQLVDGCVRTYNQDTFANGDPNFNCVPYEVADANLVARRLIEGTSVWLEDEGWGVLPGDCTLNHNGNDAAQENAADLNDNGFADVADLVKFINILNGFVMPKIDANPGNANVYMEGSNVMINSTLPVGGVLVSLNHTGTVTPVAAPGMELQSYDANGVLSVVVYSLAGNTLPAGASTVFTISGTGTIVSSSAADAYGRLLNSRPVAPIPTTFSVAQNYPNPFNAKTLIRFALPTSSDVNVNIYNITGQLVQNFSGRYDAGEHSITWDASNISSGVYFYTVKAGTFSQTMKMTLLK
jgi:hypothetical protein